MAVTNVAHKRHEGFVRNDHSTCTLHWLHYEGSDAAGTLEHNFVLHRSGNVLGQYGGVCFVKRVAISVGAGHVETARQKRFVIDAETIVAIDRRTTKVGAVVAFFEAQEFRAVRFAFDPMILTGKAQTRLN